MPHSPLHTHTAAHLQGFVQFLLLLSLELVLFYKKKRHFVFCGGFCEVCDALLCKLSSLGIFNLYFSLSELAQDMPSAVGLHP